jgi:hypothetical protein
MSALLPPAMWVDAGKSVADDGTVFWTHLRAVFDGTLVAIIAEEPRGWHLTIAHRNHDGDVVRWPAKHEMSHAHAVIWPRMVNGYAEMAEGDVDPGEPWLHIYETPARELPEDDT